MRYISSDNIHSFGRDKMPKKSETTDPEYMFERWSLELRRGAVSLAVLTLIQEGIVYGYDIMKELGKEELDMCQVEPSTLYPLLRRMEERGILEGRWSDASGKRRRVYFVTKEGKITLKRMINAWEKLNTQMTSLLEGADML